MFEALRCPDCPWKSRPKHKRPQQALTQHRQRAHGGAVEQQPLQSRPGDTIPTGFVVTFTSGEEETVPAEEHQETMDRHWFFRGGALKATFKRVDVQEVVGV